MVTQLCAGQILGSRFEIAECIGRCGMGSVFKATDLMTGRPVAVNLH